jgi:lipoprotein-anchoring transpeptidase ErfK/SrfK
MAMKRGLLGLAAAVVLLGGCRVNDDERAAETDAAAQDQQGMQQPAQPLPPGGTGQGPMQIEVNLARRELTVFRGGQPVETHPVAVGSQEWPTPTGEWTIDEVVFNPRWVPPDEEWAEDEEAKEPGDPENPLGVAQLVYRRPNSIHGTNEPGSIGQAVSHGSIRVRNEVAVELARQVMDAGGAQRDESFFQQVRSDRSREETVRIPNPVPIRVVGGR